MGGFLLCDQVRISSHLLAEINARNLTCQNVSSDSLNADTNLAALLFSVSMMSLNSVSLTERPAYDDCGFNSLS